MYSRVYVGHFYTPTCCAAYCTCCVVQAPDNMRRNPEVWEKRWKSSAELSFLLREVVLCVKVGVFLELKKCSRKEIPLLALSICVSSALPQPHHSGRQSRTSATSCNFWLVGHDGQKDGRSSVTFCTLPWSSAGMPQLIAFLSCSSQNGLKLSQLTKLGTIPARSPFLPFLVVKNPLSFP